MSSANGASDGGAGGASDGDAGGASNGGSSGAGEHGEAGDNSAGGATAGADEGAAGSSDGGAAGSSAFGAGGLYGTEDPVDMPGCFGHNSTTSPIAFAAPNSLAASLLQGGGGFMLYATHPTLNSVSIRYSDPTQSVWADWLCFDGLPQPQRIAAVNLTGEFLLPEIYVTTAQGRLFARRYYSTVDGWTQWEELTLPTASSRAIDVAGVGAPSPMLFMYIIDRDQIFMRHKLTSDGHSAYGRWALVGTPASAKHVCAVVRSDNKQQVFVLDDAGNVHTSVQLDVAPDSAFQDFEPLTDGSTLRFSELRCGYSTDGSPAIFGLSNGALWTRLQSAGAWGLWSRDTESALHGLRTLAVISQEASMPTVFGTDAKDQLWSHLVGSSSSWSTIDQ
ncbi:MAG: hypothetical protein ABUL62_06005 [Myxococcales bacterium]